MTSTKTKQAGNLLDQRTQDFLDVLHAGGQFRFLQNLNAGDAGKARRSVWFKVNEPIKLPKHWLGNDYANIFFGVNPSSIAREAWQASHNEDIQLLNCLYAEFDGKDFTNPSPDEIELAYQNLRSMPNKNAVIEKALRNEAAGAAKSTKYSTDPDYYKGLAKTHIDELSPSPSVIVSSGGGYQAYWLLDEPFLIDGDDELRQTAKTIQKRWVHFVGADRGVHDLRRILRVPGTYNHKKKYAPDYPLVEFLEYNLDTRYVLDDLVALLPPPEPEPEPIIKTKAEYKGNGKQGSVIDRFNDNNNVRDIALDLGHTEGRNGRLSHPGEPESNDLVIFIDTNTCFSHSHNNPLYNGKYSHTPFSVYCVLKHDGDVDAAVIELKKEWGEWVEARPIIKYDPLTGQQVVLSRQQIKNSMLGNGNGNHSAAQPEPDDAEQQEDKRYIDPDTGEIFDDGLPESFTNPDAPDEPGAGDESEDDDESGEDDTDEPGEFPEDDPSLTRLERILKVMAELGKLDDLTLAEKITKIKRELLGQIGRLEPEDQLDVARSLIDNIGLSKGDATKFIAAATRHVKEKKRAAEQRERQREKDEGKRQKEEKERKKKQAQEMSGAAHPPPWPYAIEEGRIVYLFYTQGADGDTKIMSKPVADFYAHITDEYMDEQGNKGYAITGIAKRGSTFTFEISAENYADTGKLCAALETFAGAKDPIYAKMGMHLGPAIKLLTLGEVIHTKHFARTGWYNDKFLIAGREPEGVKLNLSSSLPYEIDKEASLEKGLACLENSIKSMTPQQGLIIYSAMLQAPMAHIADWRDERYGVFTKGGSNKFKTSNLMVCMGLFGKGFTKKSNLIKFGDGVTHGAVMALGIQASDMPILIDNYKPSTCPPHVFISLIHNFMEGGEKKRLERISKLKESLPLFAWLFCTGEDIPAHDAATIARLLVIDADWSGGKDYLTKAQENDDHLCAVGGAWLDWIESEEGRSIIKMRSESLVDERAKYFNMLMEANPSLTTAPRIAANLASNAITFQIACLHPTIGPIFEKYEDEYMAGLAALAQEMTANAVEANEAQRYLALLNDLLFSGQAILIEHEQHEITIMKDHKEHLIVGWRAPGGGAYLIPKIARAKVDALAKDRLGDISDKTLNTQLGKLSMIGRHDKEGLLLTKRFGEKVAKVLHLVPEAFTFNPEDDQDK